MAVFASFAGGKSKLPDITDHNLDVSGRDKQETAYKVVATDGRGVRRLRGVEGLRRARWRFRENEIEVVLGQEWCGIVMRVKRQCRSWMRSKRQGEVRCEVGYSACGGD